MLTASRVVDGWSLTGQKQARMGSLNNAHHESTGGVVIFNGELILLFCDSVHCEVDGRGSVSVSSCWLYSYPDE